MNFILASNLKLQNQGRTGELLTKWTTCTNRCNLSELIISNNYWGLLNGREKSTVMNESSTKNVSLCEQVA